MPRVKPLVPRKRRDPIIRQLEELRQDAGLTKGELAKAMGIHRATLHQRYTDNIGDCTVKELRRAADALKVRLNITFEDVM